MRAKLIVLVSLVAATLASGLSFIFARILAGYWGRLITSEVFGQRSIDLILTIVLAIITNSAASVFVYRHTARKRKTQAVITSIIGLLLSIVMLSVLGWLFPPVPLRY